MAYLGIVLKVVFSKSEIVFGRAFEMSKIVVVREKF